MAMVTIHCSTCPPTLVYKTSIFLILIQIMSCIPLLATFSFLGNSIAMAPTILIAMIQIWSQFKMHIIVMCYVVIQLATMFTLQLFILDLSFVLCPYMNNHCPSDSIHKSSNSHPIIVVSRIMIMVFDFLSKTFKLLCNNFFWSPMLLNLQLNGWVHQLSLLKPIITIFSLTMSLLPTKHICQSRLTNLQQSNILHFSPKLLVQNFIPKLETVSLRDPLSFSNQPLDTVVCFMQIFIDFPLNSCKLHNFCCSYPLVVSFQLLEKLHYEVECKQWSLPIS